jgi:hypothetical protein
MSYRESFRRRLNISSLTLADWAALSAAVSLAVAVAELLFELFAWAIGWQSPLLWFRPGNGLADIAWGAALMAVPLFVLNLLGAAMLRIWFWLFSFVRRR